TRHALLPREVRTIDGGNHVDHSAGSPFLWNRIDREIRLVAAGADMTVCAVIAECGRHDSHCRNKVVDAEVFESAGCDVLKGLTRFLHWGRWGLRRSPKDQAKTSAKTCRYSGRNRQPQPELHVMSLRPELCPKNVSKADVRGKE